MHLSKEKLPVTRAKSANLSEDCWRFALACVECGDYSAGWIVANTPTVIDADGNAYAVNDAILDAIGH